MMQLKTTAHGLREASTVRSVW